MWKCQSPWASSLVTDRGHFRLPGKQYNQMRAIFPKYIGLWDRYVEHRCYVDLSSIFLVAKHSLELDSQDTRWFFLNEESCCAQKNPYHIMDADLYRSSLYF